MLDRRQFAFSVGSMVTLLPWQRALANKFQDRSNHEPLRRIAFGSCNRQSKDQSHFQQIAYCKPDLWIWLGDNIYGDNHSIDERQVALQDFAEDPYYLKFRQSVPIVGTWDDHDYASNNMGYEFEDKDASQQLMMDFLGFSQDHPSRFRQGIYSSQTYGLRGQKTHVILLDVRFFMRDPAHGSNILGEPQWAWLTNEIAKSDADLLIIGSGLNFTSKVVGLGLEGWHTFAKDRQRLLNLIDQKRRPTVLISGDRHHADISRVRLPSGRFVYEFMSSGLTHSSLAVPPNHDRIAQPVGWRNFGLIEIDWTATGPKVFMEVRAPQNHRKVYTGALADFSALG